MPIQYLLAQLHSPLPQMPGFRDHRIQNNFQALHIHCGVIVVLVLEKFRGSVKGTATELFQPVANKFIAKTKVCNVFIHLSIKKHIVWLQVPLNYATLV